MKTHKIPPRAVRITPDAHKIIKDWSKCTGRSQSVIASYIIRCASHSPPIDIRPPLIRLADSYVARIALERAATALHKNLSSPPSPQPAPYRPSSAPPANPLTPAKPHATVNP